MLETIIIFILILALLVFVHELGHFVMAIKTGMPVEEFGIGFPPRLWSFKKGTTRYSINLIPLGGFVKITGENGEADDNSNAFQHKKIWQRFVVLVAGVTMNIVLAFVVLSIGFMIGLPAVIGDSAPNHAKVHNQQLQIIEVLNDSPAAVAGIKLNDIVLSINNEIDLSATRVQEIITTSNGDEVNIVLQRESEEMSLMIKPEILEKDHYMVGIGVAETGIISYSFFRAIWEGLVATVLLLWQIISAFGLMIFHLFTKGSVVADISGPVGIAIMTGDVINLGYAYVLQFIAILSLNLAIINIIPFPALDGGKILFLIIEKIKGSPVNTKVENLIHNFGFIFLILLVIFVTYRDILKL